MPALAIDTCLDACQVALARGDEVLAVLSESMSRGHAERLPAMASEAIAAARCAPSQIDRVIVTVGPGSFTGLRIGLAFARAFALARGAPCLGVNTLEALALETGGEGLRGAVLETKGGLFLAFYEDGAPLLAPRLVARTEVAPHLAAAAAGRPFLLSGPAVGDWASLSGVTPRIALAPDIAALARRACRAEPARHPPHPLYLRAPLS